MVPSAPPSSLAGALDRLPATVRRRLRAVATAAHERAWLVGGVVRDLLLERQPADWDLTIEGDAQTVAQRLPVAIVKTTVFGTVTIRWSDGSLWDLATARREEYERPAALPRVTPADLAADLARRDFTVNAVAVSLSRKQWGTVRDPHGGVLDLAARRVRVLHPGSFRDDPTRLFRAARYAARLGLRLERTTGSLFAAAVAERLVDALTPDRVRHELVRSLTEPEVTAQLSLLAHTGLLAAVSPGLVHRPSRTRRTARLLTMWPVPADESWAAHLAGLPTSSAAAAALSDRLSLDRSSRGLVVAVADRAEQGGWRPARRPAVWVARLTPYPAGAVVALAARWPSLAGPAERYLTDWQHVRPLLDGHGILALGVPPGPALGRLVSTLRDARLDGLVHTAEDEAAWVRAHWPPENNHG